MKLSRTMMIRPILALLWVTACPLTSFGEEDSGNSVRFQDKDLSKLKSFENLDVVFMGENEEKIGLSQVALTDFLKLQYENHLGDFHYRERSQKVWTQKLPEDKHTKLGQDEIGNLLIKIWTEGDHYPLAYYMELTADSLENQTVYTAPCLGYCSKDNIVGEVKQNITELMDDFAITFLEARGEYEEIDKNGYVVWHGSDGSEWEIFLTYGERDWDPQIENDGYVVWYGGDKLDREIYLCDGMRLTQVIQNFYDDQFSETDDKGLVLWAKHSGSQGDQGPPGEFGDMKPPTINHDAPSFITQTDLPLIIHFTIEDDKEVAFYVIQNDQLITNNKTAYIEPGMAVVTFSSIFDYSNTVIGLNTFLVVASDAAGNTARLKVEFEVEQRFTDLGNGTVRDNNTGLTWLKNANCFGEMYYSDAMTRVESIKNGECDLFDRSDAGDWRMPTIAEWKVFIDKNYTCPVLCNSDGRGQWSESDPFNHVESEGYWSSSKHWSINMHNGSIWVTNKAVSTHYVWPVHNE